MNNHQVESIFRNYILFFSQTGEYKWSDPSVDLKLLSLVDSNLSKADKDKGYHLETYKEGNLHYTLLSCRFTHPQLSDRVGGIGYHHAIIYSAEYEPSIVEADLLLRYEEKPLQSVYNLYSRLCNADTNHQLRILKIFYLPSPNRFLPKEYPKAEERNSELGVTMSITDNLTNRTTWIINVLYLLILIISISVAWNVYEIRSLRKEMTIPKFTTSPLQSRSDSGLPEIKKGIEQLAAEEIKFRQELSILSESLSDMTKRISQIEDGISAIRANSQQSVSNSKSAVGLKGIESQISELRKNTSQLEGKLSAIQSQLGRIYDGVQKLYLKPGDSGKEHVSPQDKSSLPSSQTSNKNEKQ